MGKTLRRNSENPDRDFAKATHGRPRGGDKLRPIYDDVMSFEAPFSEGFTVDELIELRPQMTGISIGEVLRRRAG